MISTMIILIKLNHPAHYHLFKNFANQMIKKNHDVLFVINEKEILSKLLDESNTKYIKIGIEKFYTKSTTLILESQLINLLKSEIELYNIIKKLKPDFLLGTDVTIAHLGFLTKIPSFVFNEDDIEINKIFCYATYPFCNFIISPLVCNVGRFTHKKIGYDGYQKLAYLHPNYFEGNITILKSDYQKACKKYIIRIVSFSAVHDLEKKHSGLREDLLDKIIFCLKDKGEIFISSEKEIPKKYRQYKLNINLNDIHHYLYFADLFISDSQSMTVESAILGTPSLRFNSFAGKISVLNELEYKYSLTHSFNINEEEKFLNKLEELLNQDKLKQIYLSRREEMLKEKIDLTSFLIWFFENYPDSLIEYKKNPEIQYRFK